MSRLSAHPTKRRAAGEPATLRQIAREAGVSVATVSRAIRQPDTVAEATRQRILDLVARHHYVPDARATGFSSRRTGLVGLIVPTISNSIYAAFTEAVQNRLQAAGRKLLIANTNYSATIEDQIVRKLVEGRVEGVIFTGYRRDPALYELLRHYRIPFVVTWSTSPDPAVPAISFDNVAASKAATETLISLGHRRIGLICGVSAVNDRALQRIAGYRAALTKHGMAFDAHLVKERPFDAAEGAAAAEELMRTTRPPTAIFCANDIQALGALFACQRLGISVPEQLSIIGFDDLPMIRVTHPPLSTVHVPAHEMGEAAADALVDAVETQRPIRSRSLAAKIIMRGSHSPFRR
jgi:LacI family transcriptional regulator